MRPFLDNVVGSIEVPDVASAADELTGRWPRTLLVEADSLCFLAIWSGAGRVTSNVLVRISSCQLA
jgi:hypothetical protein